MIDQQTIDAYRDAVKRLRAALELLKSIKQNDRMNYRIDGAEVRIENAIHDYEEVIGRFYAGANQ